jgi:uncharacterized protein YqiB (DUF1249 family)
MLADSLIVPECIYRPGSFSGLMTVYESNFIKLGKLIEWLDRPEAACTRFVSRTDRDCDLHIEVLSREAYTTTLKMTYWFALDQVVGGSSELIADPDLTLKIYHDARLAEAVAAKETHRHAVLQALALRHSLELGRRWRRNIMLNKWLDYVLEMGHAFP